MVFTGVDCAAKISGSLVAGIHGRAGTGYTVWFLDAISK